MNIRAAPSSLVFVPEFDTCLIASAPSPSEGADAALVPRNTDDLNSSRIHSCDDWHLNVRLPRHWIEAQVAIDVIRKCVTPAATNDTNGGCPCGRELVQLKFYGLRRPTAAHPLAGRSTVRLGSCAPRLKILRMFNICSVAPPCILASKACTSTPKEPAIHSNRCAASRRSACSSDRRHGRARRSRTRHAVECDCMISVNKIGTAEQLPGRRVVGVVPVHRIGVAADANNVANVTRHQL